MNDIGFLEMSFILIINDKNDFRFFFLSEKYILKVIDFAKLTTMSEDSMQHIFYFFDSQGSKHELFRVRVRVFHPPLG